MIFLYDLSEINEQLERVQAARAIVIAYWKWELKLLRDMEEWLRVLQFRASFREGEADED